MRSIEIVTHCWSGSDVPIYHKLLQLQLTSILQCNKTDLHVKVSVCYSPPDIQTVKVLRRFLDSFEKSKDLELDPHALDHSLLFRRAIGRNICALETEADVVWFTDCDHLFMSDSLQIAHQKCIESDAIMVFPSHVYIHNDHRYGDELIEKTTESFSPTALPDKFHRRQEKKAIGGIQIVKGSYCREHGYLNGTSWVRPVSSEQFLQCRCDVPFRKSVSVERVDIPSVYRVRHSRAGRDGGTKDHGERTRSTA